MEITLDTRTQELVREYIPDRITLRAIANFFSCLSDSTRVKLLSALSISPMCVSDLTEMLALNQTTVSHQLKTMREGGLIDYQRDGKVLTYYVSQPKILDVLLSVTEII
ncbi:MAG: metalloregulator ArsR/SmtB family transcription factor [Firmicutes bacterium]|nr:metalloregulator ArsR/SmtB family transcription factor [Bacillota bacterium]